MQIQTTYLLTLKPLLQKSIVHTHVGNIPEYHPKKKRYNYLFNTIKIKFCNYSPSPMSLLIKHTSSNKIKNLIQKLKVKKLPDMIK